MTKPARVRRSRSVIMNFYGRDLFAYDFRAQKESYIDGVALALLSDSSDWIEVHKLTYNYLNYYPLDLVKFRLSELIGLQFIVVEGTKNAHLDKEYEVKWAWGPTAGYYHFGIKDPYYMNPEETSSWLYTRVQTKVDVPLFQTNENFSKIINLSKPNLKSGIFRNMRNRRSYRGFDPKKPITSHELQQCLFAGMGIIGFIETPMSELSLLPMKMTPSGGGRNPFEAYVYVNAVKNIPKGIYHYSGSDHTLGLVKDTDLPSIGKMLATQPWFDNAAALIMLVANFERTMWKYPHPTGFRVVLLEAGHIAQNFLLAATALDLASAPTCAVSDSIMQEALQLDSITQAVIYTVSIGKKSKTPTQADVVKVIPNSINEQR